MKSLGVKTQEAMLVASHWLISEKYRTLQHRHDGSYRAIDQASGDEWRAESLAGLVELMKKPEGTIPKGFWECKTCGFSGKYAISEVATEHARFNGDFQKYCPGSPKRLFTFGD